MVKGNNLGGQMKAQAAPDSLRSQSPESFLNAVSAFSLNVNLRGGPLEVSVQTPPVLPWSERGTEGTGYFGHFIF
jgi:hypothetical protein